MSLCCNVSKVKIIEVIDILSVLPIVVEIEKDTFLCVIEYRMPGPLDAALNFWVCKNGMKKLNQALHAVMAANKWLK